MKYSYELKNYIVKQVVDKHKSTSLTAKEFDIPLKTLEKWITAYNKNNNCFTSEYYVEKNDVTVLRKKYHDALKDNEILKKMIISMSKKTK